MSKEGIPYLLIDLKHNFQTEVTIYPENYILMYPHYDLLKKNLDEIIKKFGIVQNGLHAQTSEMDIERDRKFSLEVRRLFFDDLSCFTRYFEMVFQKDEDCSFDSFRDIFLKIYKEQNSGNNNAFIDEFTKVQSFAYLYDEMCCNRQGNYSRMYVMKNKAKKQSGSDVDIKLNFTNKNVEAFINRLAENTKHSPHKEKPNCIKRKEKCNWLKYIENIEKDHCTHTKNVFSKGDPSIFKQSYAVSTSTRESKGLTIYDIDKICNTSKISPTGINFSPFEEKKGGIQNNSRTFYGTGGFQDFISLLFPSKDIEIHTKILLDDVKRQFESIRKSHADLELPEIKEESICNFKEDIQAPKNTQLESNFLKFSKHSSSQFFLYCALYNNKQKLHIFEVIKVTS